MDTMSKLTPEWQQANVLEAVFDQLSDGIVLYDPDLIITGVNKAAEDLFGMTAEEMTGRSCRDVFRCGVCEPGCGMLIGLNQPAASSGCTVRDRKSTRLNSSHIQKSRMPSSA